jgi:Fe2+ or Zn2+ uptake regulation protein
MKHKVKCAICGKIATVEINNKTKEIKSEWGYFGKIKLQNGKTAEYWECKDCLKEKEANQK